MGSLFEAAASLSARDRRRFWRKLSKLSRTDGTGGRYAGLVAATGFETRLPGSTWRTFLDVVLAAPSKVLPDNVREWARNAPATEARAHFTPPLVRVAGRGALKRDWMEQAKNNKSPITTPAALDLILEELCHKTRWPIGLDTASKYVPFITTYTTWATFGDGPAGSYAGLTAMTAESVACDLGFDRDIDEARSWVDDLPLMCFEYHPGSEKVRFPTIIDAWAATYPNYYFMPAPPMSPHGITRPWASPPHPDSRSRPEVVHRPTALNNIQAAMKEIR